MTKEVETPNVTKVDSPASMTMEQLFKMFLDSQKEQAKANEKLAEALENNRKPYVDPRFVAEMEQRRKDRKELVDQEMKKRAIAKKVCPHVNEGGKLNIKWHQHSNGIILGVCGTCQSQFDATHNVQDASLFRSDLKAQRNMGRAGEHARKGTDVAIG